MRRTTNRRPLLPGVAGEAASRTAAPKDSLTRARAPRSGCECPVPCHVCCETHTRNPRNTRSLMRGMLRRCPSQQHDDLRRFAGGAPPVTRSCGQWQVSALMCCSPMHTSNAYPGMCARVRWQRSPGAQRLHGVRCYARERRFYAPAGLRAVLSAWTHVRWWTLQRHVCSGRAPLLTSRSASCHVQRPTPHLLPR